MQDLIERLEKATGPDKALDYDIRCLVAPNTADSLLLQSPPYTGSIDSALTLLPDDYECEIGTGNDRIGEKSWASAMPKLNPILLKLEFYAEGATPAIAISTVALKARQAMAKQATDPQSATLRD